MLWGSFVTLQPKIFVLTYCFHALEQICKFVHRCETDRGLALGLNRQLTVIIEWQNLAANL